MPESATVCGLPTALSVIVSVAVLEPSVCGLKATFIAQLVRGARVPPEYSTGVFHLHVTRQYNEALPEARRGLELSPDAPLLHDLLSGIYAQTQQPRLAAEEALKAEESWGASQERTAALRHAYEASGAEGLWRKRVELNKKVAGHQYLNAFDIANDYALLGDRSETLDWLERAYRVRDLRFPYVRFIPCFDSVRSDPRFQDLVRGMNFPQPETK